VGDRLLVDTEPDPLLGGHRPGRLLDLAKTETDRLRRTLDLREMINDRYLPEGARPLKTRTLRSLMADIAVERAARTP